jgi:hypothetical protein
VATVATKLFQAWHSEHCPTHFADCAPQLVHVKLGLFFDDMVRIQ